MKTKYLIKHNVTQMWLCIDGSLTEDQNDKFVLSYNWIGHAENWLKPIREKWNSDFTGRVRRRDTMQDMMIGMQHISKEKLALSGISLYDDFVVVEFLEQ